VRIGVAVLLLLGGASLAPPPAAAQLHVSVNLYPNYLFPQSQQDPHWGGFPIGPSQNVVSIADETKRINIARCGCAITSLSTALTGFLAAGVPYFAHDQFGPSGFEPESSFSPKYIDDFLNIGPNPKSPKIPGWGYSAGGGSICAVAVYPWALRRIAEVGFVPGSTTELTPTGATWAETGRSASSLAEVDRALLNGKPSMIYRKIIGGNGLHANLIVGWDNAKQKYLIFDPMWSPFGDGIQVGGYNYGNGDTEDERYSNWLAAIQRVFVLRPFANGRAILNRSHTAETSDWLAVESDTGDPIRMRLTDPRGRRTGYDPTTQQLLQEDTETFLSEFTNFADPLGTLPDGAPTSYIAALGPEAGTYGLLVTGKADGPFTLKLSTVTGVDQTPAATITGTIANGGAKRYSVTRTEAGAVAIEPVASFGPSARAGNDVYSYAGSTVNFDGRGSQQPDGAVTAYAWAFGDGSAASGAQATHAYGSPGTYTATLTVTGAGGLTATDTRQVTVVAPPSHPKETIRVNTSSAGVAGNDATWFGPDVTPDGRFVSFSARSNNLGPTDSNGLDDIYVKDLSDGSVDLVSVSNAEAQGNNHSFDSSITPDGRFVAFWSGTTNFGSANPGFYVRDRQLGTTEFIYRGEFSRVPTISDDGRFVAFATNTPIPPETNSNDTVYIYDRQLATFEYVGVGLNPQLSGDGNFVSFSGYDLDAPDLYFGILVFDRVGNTTEVASVSPAGQRLQKADRSSISSDGRFVVFDVGNSGAPGSPAPPFNSPDVYLRDRQLDVTEKINTGSFEVPNGGAVAPWVSPTGRFVSFNWGPTLELNTTFHLYVRDRAEGTFEQMDVSSGGEQGYVSDRQRSSPMTTDGEPVFWSGASNLVADDVQFTTDIFMRRLLPPTNAPATPLANLGGPYVGWATSAEVPTAIRLDGGDSLDPGGRAMTGHWDFGDGTPAVDAGLVTSHAYATPGVYTATLTVHAGTDVSVARQTEVEVLAALAPVSITAPVCAAAGGSIALQGSAVGANATLISRGWDTSTGPVQTAPVTITLPWGQLQASATMPSLTFDATSTVPGGFADGSYAASIPGSSAPLALPCPSRSDQLPIAVAGGPFYTGRVGAAVTLDGTQSSDPENAPLSYAWDFGDGTTGTGATPAHSYASPGTYTVRLVVHDGTASSVFDIGTRSFAQVVVDPAPTQTGPPVVPAPIVAGPATPKLSPDAACANDQLRLTDLYPLGRRVQLRGVAPAATRGQVVTITFAATGKRVATAVVGADLSFKTTAPLPARKLRGSSKARYTASIGASRSPALKLARRMFLQSVTRTAGGLTVTGQVIKPLATTARDRRVKLRVTTTCSVSGGRTLTVVPSRSGAFKLVVKLTPAERAAPALYVRGESKIRAGARARRPTRTFTLTRGVSLAPAT